MPKEIRPSDAELAEQRRELERTHAQEMHGTEAELLQRVFEDRVVLDHLPEVVCLLDRDQVVLYLSRTVPSRNLDDVYGTRARDYVLLEQRARFDAAFERAWSSREPQIVEYYSTSNLWWQTRFVPIQQAGNVVQMLAASMDISERVREQTARRESENRLKHAIELVDMGTWSHDWSSDELTWNDAMRKIFGVATTPHAYPEFLALVHPDDREIAEGAAARGRATGNYGETEFRIVRPSGEVRQIRAKGGWQYDDAGKATGALGAVFDVTERKRLEEQLAQRQKMEAVGELTAGVAHNFNNLLGIILPNLELLKEEAPPQLGQCLADLEHAAMRAADLVRQLMLFVRRGAEVRKVPLDPVPIVRTVVNMCWTTFDPGIGVALEIAPNIPKVIANSGQLEQVLLNMCLNARDALVEARTPSPQISITVDRTVAGRVRVRVRDNGPGMDEITRSRVFEPFFTTKEVGRGTGLGLATAYAIIRDHGGRIACESQPNRGAMFEIELPGLDLPTPTAESAAAGSGAQPLRARGAGETIVVVDDEVLVRRATRGMLVRHGYRVVECSNGEELLALFETSRPEVDLILLDRMLPGQSGEEVLTQLRARAPEIPVVLMSGQPFGNSSAPQADAALLKPVSTDNLLYAIRDVLVRAAQRRR
jgi:PAS domain S-box-containing protein